MMQNLKGNWYVSSKLTWEIWRILAQALENLRKLHSNGLLLTKAYNVWTKKKVQRSYDMKNVANFHQNTFESLKIGIFQRRKCMSLKFTGKLCVMTVKNDEKFEKKLTCQFKTDRENLTNCDPSTWKSQKLALESVAAYGEIM